MLVKSTFAAFQSPQQRPSSVAPFSTEAVGGGGGAAAAAGTSPSSLHERELEDGQGTESPSDEGTPEGDWYHVGTRVSAEFPEGRKFGFITEYNRDTSTYTIEYDDESTDFFPLGSLELDNMVSYVEEYVAYEVGTEVYREEDQAYGKIIDFENFLYTIKWYHGPMERIYEGETVTSWVEAAIDAPEPPAGSDTDDYVNSVMSQGGSDTDGGGMKAIAIIAIVAASFVLLFSVARKSRNGSYEKGLGREQVITGQYKDHNKNLHDLELSHLT
jgi:hypothetical protein